MNKTPEQYAKELIEKYKPLSNGTDVIKGVPFTNNELWNKSSIQCAIIDVQNTIEALPFGFYSGKHNICDEEYYTQVLTILKTI